MARPVIKRYKSLISILIAAVLLAGMIPLSSLPGASAMPHPVFTVEIDNSIKGSISVTLTNAMDPSETQTKHVIAGTAKFTDFVETDNIYDISVTGMTGYEDYYEAGMVFGDISASFDAAGFDPLDTIVVSGQITGENSENYTGGGTVIYSRYDSGSTALGDDGSFSVIVYKGKPYEFIVEPADPKYSRASLGVIDSLVDIADLDRQLTVRTFSIATGAGPNGTIGEKDSLPLTDVLYGSKRSIITEADPGYLISGFTVDGVFVQEAAGLEAYAHTFDNLDDSYSVSVIFALQTWEVTFTFNSDGTIKDGLSNPINTGGIITADEGPSPSFTAIANEDYHISNVTIDSEEQTDGTFDNAQTAYSYTFIDIDADHTVTVAFSLNSYKVNISASGSGSITVDGAPAGSTQIISHGGSLVLTLTPEADYDVAEVLLDETPVDEYDLLDDGVSYSYIIPAITADLNVSVTFKRIEVLEGDETGFYSIIAPNLIDGYPEVSDGMYVYSFINNNASATFVPEAPYSRIRLNGIGNNTSIRLTGSAIVRTIEVFKQRNPGKGWKIVKLEYPIQIIIDKTAPEVADIPPMDWTNQDYIINIAVTDENTQAAPSSGLSIVVWSKTELTKAQALAEDINIITNKDGMYQLKIETEQDNETFYFYALDRAQNVSGAKTIDVKIDKTKPEITEFLFQKIEPPVVAQVINFLSFGTFYNDAVEVVITAQDVGISSGLKEITLYSDGVAVETKEVAGSSAAFILTLDDFKENEVSASVNDIAGNESEGSAKPTEVTTNSFSDIVSLSTEKPTISIAPANTPVYSSGGRNWYNRRSIGFNVSVESESGGIYSVTIKVNGQIITTDKNGKPIDDGFFESQTMKETFLVNTDYNPKDGENIIEVIAVNNYGNEETADIKVYIDTTNPRIVGFDIANENDGAFSKTLHFLSFGNFFSKKVKVTVTADDRYGATSGIRSITLYVDGNPLSDSSRTVTAAGNGTSRAEFILPESIVADKMMLDAVLSAVATDNVGNITGNGTPVTPSAVNRDLASDRLMVETVNPVISISAREAAYVDNANRKWYPDDVMFTVTARDADAGIRSVRIKINNVDIQTDADGKSINANFYSTQTHEEVFRISTSQGARAGDGSYFIEVAVVDNAGNEYFASEKVYKDTDNPYITEFRFIPATSDGIGETSEFIEYMQYGFYFKEEFIAVAHVSDREPSSGLKEVRYRLVSYQDGKKTDEKSGTQAIVDGMAVLTIPKGFKGQVLAEAFDNTGNKSKEVTPMAFVVDGTPPEISITNNSTTSYNDASGNKLYVSDMSFTVAVTDYGSGIRELGYSKNAEREPFARKSILIDKTGYEVGDILGDGWVVSEMDMNIVTKVTKTFSYGSDDNNIMLTFDATDCSGNTRENVRSEAVTIDKTPPVINVTFRIAEAVNNYYYHVNRIADVTVIERNFDPDLIRIAIENSYGAVPAFSFTRVSNDEHTAVIIFDEGDYTFDVSGTDLGDHIAIVNFAGENERYFYVDKTKPVVEDNFDTFRKSETNDSFNIDMTATIKVTEHNFDPDLVNVKIKKKDAGSEHTDEDFFDATYEALSGAQWVSAEDVHTLSFTLSKDGVYQIVITPSDLAGNTSEYRSTVVFEIDQTAPVVKARNGLYVKGNDTEFLDVYLYPRKDDPAPTVEFEDLNIDHIKYRLTVYIPDYTTSEAVVVIRPAKVFLDEDQDKSGMIIGSKFTLPDFTKDGIYALELIAVDVAGNESLPDLNTYARMIDQDVLAFILESNLAEKTGVYSIQYENGNAISKRPDNFSDLKILVLAKKDTGIDIVLRDNNADEINTNAQCRVDNSIYGVGIYNYLLRAEFFKENFQDDTDVELRLAVKNQGYRIDLGKLHIDNIAPVCSLPEELKSWNWFYGDEDRTITVSDISELIDEHLCKVYDNGKEIGFEYLSENNSIVFTLEKGWHNVGVILSDMAGNANNIQEKRNIHIGFFWMWVLSASSVVLVIAIVSIIINNAKRKRRLENEYYI